MVEESRKEEILAKLSEAVVEFDDEVAEEWSQIAIDEGIDAYDAIIGGLAAGMERVGQLYECKEYFVPELLLCADALNAGLDVLKPHIENTSVSETGTVILGSVQGDIHDIGKNIVKLMLEVGGLKVVDLGKDVPPEKFVEAQEESNADIVALSAMMTTTMMGMKKVIELFKTKKTDVAIMVGGAPVTQQIADLFGVDGYADSAVTAAQVARELINKRAGLSA
ncbi:MAG: corrinoid protein [Proteobacteria bacterium]|nr:corrinoid protein [Pseudomonadota bacterium]